MSDYTNDARFQEIQFLSHFERNRWKAVCFDRDGSTFEQAKEYDMILSLLDGDMLNGPDIRARSFPDMYEHRHETSFAAMWEHRDRHAKAELIARLLHGDEIHLELGHEGRKRLARLRDELKATRLREMFGILFDGRHVERDLAIAIFNSRPEAPVSLAYLDMNGLKAFNEDGDHTTGDIAIKTFFHAVEKAVAGAGDAYRKGGDEVVVIMPGTPLKEARQRMRALLESLTGETVDVKGEPRALSSACGLLEVSSPQVSPHDELNRVDHLQKEAKAASKLDGERRCSALRVDGDMKMALIGD